MAESACYFHDPSNLNPASDIIRLIEFLQLNLASTNISLRRLSPMKMPCNNPEAAQIAPAASHILQLNF